MNNLVTIIMAPIFIIILLVTYQVAKSAFNFGLAGTLILSTCVSLLSVSGMKRFLRGSLEVILIPYAALAVMFFVLLILSFIVKHVKNSAERFAEYSRKKLRSESKETKRNAQTRNIPKLQDPLWRIFDE